MHSFRTLLADLATLTRNTLATAAAPDAPFTLTTRPTPTQHKTFTLLGLPVPSSRPARRQFIPPNQCYMLPYRQKFRLEFSGA